MRIAILTFHRAYNCGAMLQAWALQRVLTKMGHVAEFPMLNRVGETRRWMVDWFNHEKRGLAGFRAFLGRSAINLLSIPSEDVLRCRYRSFRSHYLKEAPCDINRISDQYDLVIVGSDQVWRAEICYDDAPLFLAETLPTGIRKITYAASYGDYPLDGDSLLRVARAVERFDCVSVRENLARSQLSGVVRKDIKTVIDPTLLLETRDYDEIALPTLCKEPYLFMYALNAEPFYVQSARALAGRLGVKCIVAPCYQYTRLNAQKGLTYSVSPERLVTYIKHAKYVLAASFHGTALGVLFGKPVLSFRHAVDQHESRPAALLNQIGAGDRIVNPTCSIETMLGRLVRPIDVQTCELLVQLRNRSLDWLQRAIG